MQQFHNGTLPQHRRVSRKSLLEYIVQGLLFGQWRCLDAALEKLHSDDDDQDNTIAVSYQATGDESPTYLSSR